MRELDGLRAALAGVGTPWRSGYRDGSGPGYITTESNDAVARVKWGCSCCECERDLRDDEKRALRAIVSAVNLAAPLAAVAEAAEALLPELDTDPGTRGAALRDAVDTLKAAAASKEGA